MCFSPRQATRIESAQSSQGGASSAVNTAGMSLMQSMGQVDEKTDAICVIDSEASAQAAISLAAGHYFKKASLVRLRASSSSLITT